MINSSNKDFFIENGWLKVSCLFKKEEIKKITNEVNKFLRKNFLKYNGRDINFTNYSKKFNQINSFHKLDDCKFVKKLSKNRKLVNITKNLLSCKKVKLKASEYFAKPKKTGLYVPIHQDNYYWNIINGDALTVWIALSKTRKKNGAVLYFNKSHKNGIYPHKASYAKGSSQTLRNSNILLKFNKATPELNIGDAIFHHCQVLHGSRPNKSNTSRKGITFQFKKNSAKYDYNKINKYEKNLKSKINKRSKFKDK
tara:strand:- start:13 stop:774 length:762 start_codon:yes stop_codon:yes gene_type:complete